MAKYVIILKKGKEKTVLNEKTPVKNHVEHIRELDQNGILFLSGLFKGNKGAMLILETKTYKEAEKHLLEDPFIIRNYNYEIYELMEANKDNDYLLKGSKKNTK
jgi:uncharacterized protein YciI